MNTAATELDQIHALYLDAFCAKDHQPQLDESGCVDWSAYDNGDFHNGPACRICGWSACYHCIGEDYDEIPACTDVQRERTADRLRWAREQAEAEEAIRAAERAACLRRVERVCYVAPELRRAITGMTGIR